jgi:hypothetical protein
VCISRHHATTDTHYTCIRTTYYIAVVVHTTSIEQTLELHSTRAHSRALSHELGVPPFFSHAFSSKVLCIIVYTLDIWLALVHVMHCMALVHHVHGVPTYLPTYMVPGTYILASAATCMLLGGYHMICSTLNNWESMCLPTWFNGLSFLKN